MRTIGLIGGMSWESTAIYYRRLNELVRDRLGGLHSAKVLVTSVDFEPVARMQADGDWEAARALMTGLAHDLKRAGADFIVVATNTMHKVVDEIEAVTGLPLLHIVDATAIALRNAGKTRPLLLATRFTMEDGFYVDRLRACGLDVAIPAPEDRFVVHRVIYEELCKGRVEPSSKEAFLAIIAKARQSGIDSVILGCTEIGLLLSQSDIAELVFDSTEIHVRSAVDLALQNRRPDGSYPALHLPRNDGLKDAVSLWRLQNMTAEERLAALGPPRPRSIYEDTAP
jgi:aspartate racemase